MLIQEIQLLAKSINIRSNITDTKTSAGNPCWALSFSSIDTKNWAGQYLQEPEKLQRIVETEVDTFCPPAAKDDLVPISYGLVDAFCKAFVAKKNDVTEEDRLRRRMTASLSCARKCKRQAGYVSRNTANIILKMLIEYNLTVEHPHFEAWKAIVANSEITWEYVVDVNETNRPQTGYDLTVPGSDTFINAEGVVLSNTMNYHVPVSTEAVQEAYELMMPSKNLIGAGDMQTPIMTPTAELAFGISMATEKPSDKPTKWFDSLEAAKRAYRAGNIDLNDKIRIIGNKNSGKQ